MPEEVKLKKLLCEDGVHWSVKWDLEIDALLSDGLTQSLKESHRGWFVSQTAAREPVAL